MVSCFDLLLLLYIVHVWGEIPTLVSLTLRVLCCLGDVLGEPLPDSWLTADSDTDLLYVWYPSELDCWRLKQDWKCKLFNEIECIVCLYYTWYKNEDLLHTGVSSMIFIQMSSWWKHHKYRRTLYHNLVWSENILSSCIILINNWVNEKD